jgi:dipeptidyl-peptidase-4
MVSVTFCLITCLGERTSGAADNTGADEKRQSTTDRREHGSTANADKGDGVRKHNPNGHRTSRDPVVRTIEGWTVHVDPALLDGEHSEVGTRALAMLRDHLRRIAVLVTGDQLQKLQQSEIWIEHRHPELASMQYHPSVEWLKEHGHDPRLAKKVHITRAEALLSRQQMVKHPWVILHELAHAYHDQHLGFDEPRIKRAYQAAKDEGIYKDVLLYTGDRGRHYGLTDHKEYFAEGTEAYFARNDFYPFVRAELKKHDARLHDLLEEIWGPLR